MHVIVKTYRVGGAYLTSATESPKRGISGHQISVGTANDEIASGLMQLKKTNAVFNSVQLIAHCVRRVMTPSFV